MANSNCHFVQNKLDLYKILKRMHRKSIFFSLILGVMAWQSCADSNAREKFNLPDPSDFDGPRLISTVKTTGGTLVGQYILKNSYLTKVNRTIYEGTVNKGSQSIDIVYNGATITQLTVVGYLPGYGNALTAKVTPTYDPGTGRVTSIYTEFLEGTTLKAKESTAIDYNGQGLPSRFFKLYSTPGTNPSIFQNVRQTFDNITYDGANVAVVDELQNTLNATGAVTQSTTWKTIYGNYDFRVNPYRTLPQTYKLLLSVLSPADFILYSQNNHQQKTEVLNFGTPVVTNYQYQYDTHDYPVRNQFQTFTYQLLP